MAKNEATLLIRIKQLGAEALDKISENLNVLKQGAAIVGTAIVGFAAAAIHAFKEQEQASNALSQSMVQQGIYTKDLKKSYDDMAGSLQKTTTYADEQITAAQAVLQSQIGQIPITEKLMKATLDLAAAKKIDLSTAAEMVGKTVGSETNALARQGIQIDDNATKTEKLAMVTDALNKKFGGQAEAAAKGLGSLEQLKNVVGDVAEKAGEVLSPAVTLVAQELIKLFTQMKEGTTAFSALNYLFVNLMVILNGVVSYIADVGSGIGAMFGTIAGAAEQAIQGNFKNAMNVLKEGNAEINQMHAQNEAEAIARADKLNALLEQKQTEHSQTEIELIKQSEANKAAVKQQAYDQETAIKQARAQEEYDYNTQLQMAELQSVGSHQDAVLQLKIAHLDKQIEATTNYHTKRKLLDEKAGLQEKLREEELAKAKVALQRDTFGTISTLSSANNKNLAAIGKAAGVTQIAIDTPVAVSKALAAFPPPFNFAAAGLVGAAMAAQAAKIAGIPLAEGGIVRATPGGIQATIGEGGRDEAVIPLDSPDAQGRLGGGSTIIFNGPVLGDESQAMEFARAIDRSLLKLRQTGQSVAFETDIF